MLEDSFCIGIGEKLVHANQVSCKVQIVRGELDYFLRPEDVSELQRDLVNTEEVHTWAECNALRPSGPAEPQPQSDAGQNRGILS